MARCEGALSVWNVEGDDDPLNLFPAEPGDPEARCGRCDYEGSFVDSHDTVDCDTWPACFDLTRAGSHRHISNETTTVMRCNACHAVLRKDDLRRDDGSVTQASAQNAIDAFYTAHSDHMKVVTTVPCCSLCDGVHDAGCATNEERQMYRCAKCGTPTAQFAMRFGHCSTCAPKLDEIGHGSRDAAERWTARLLGNR